MWQLVLPWIASMAPQADLGTKVPSPPMESSQEKPVMRSSPPGTPSPHCVFEVFSDGGQGVLQEQRRLGSAWPDFPSTYPSAKPEPKTYKVVEAVAAFGSAGTPWLWFTPDLQQAVVRDDVFATPVHIIDATNLAVGQRVVVTSLVEAARAQIDPKRLAEFLLRSEAIRIYAHIEGKVCLRKESSTAAGWQGEFVGDHTYYTQEQVTRPLHFMVEVTTQGDVLVVGLTE